MNISTRGAAKAAESERLCSDPLNLLVNASVGMWFANNVAMQTPWRLHCFFISKLPRGP